VSVPDLYLCPVYSVISLPFFPYLCPGLSLSVLVSAWFSLSGLTSLSSLTSLCLPWPLSIYPDSFMCPEVYLSILDSSCLQWSWVLYFSGLGLCYLYLSWIFFDCLDLVRKSSSIFCAEWNEKCKGNSISLAPVISITFLMGKGGGTTRPVIVVLCYCIILLSCCHSIYNRYSTVLINLPIFATWKGPESESSKRKRKKKKENNKNNKKHPRCSMGIHTSLYVKMQLWCLWAF